MRTRARVLIALGALAAGGLIVASLLRHATVEPIAESTAAASPAALFAASFPDVDGRLQPLQQWRGQVLVVNFWATWCPPCLEEMPELSALQQKYRAQGLVIVGISTDDAAKVQQFARSSPVSYPLLSGDYAAMTLAEQLGNDQSALPYTVLLRRDGSIASGRFGRLNIEALEHALQPLLATSP
jgi:thiol-disulfide isomerase/thioredoxin